VIATLGKDGCVMLQKCADGKYTSLPPLCLILVMMHSNIRMERNFSMLFFNLLSSRGFSLRRSGCGRLYEIIDNEKG